MATHSSILAWTIPWTVEPGRLQSTQSTMFFQSPVFLFGAFIPLTFKTIFNKYALIDILLLFC